jgi:membrane protein
MKKSWYRTFGSFISETVRYFFSMRPTRMASSLSYYGLFSLVPLLVIAFWIGSTIIDTKILSEEIIERTSYVLGHQATGFLQTTFTNIINADNHPVRAIIAIIILIFLAVTGIAELKQSIDDIWQTPYQQTTSVISWLLRYLVPLLATVAFGIIFVLFIIVAKFFQAGFTLGITEWVRNFISIVAAPLGMFIISTLGTFVVYLLLPDRHIPHKQLFVGALITGFFLTLGNLGLSIYLTQETTLSTYGVAGSIIAILLWFYYSALMFLFGASTTWVYYTRGMRY